MTDNELQHLLKAEPEKGQRAFYDKYFNYVYTIVFAKLKTIASIEDVDECVGDVFAQCFIFFDKQEVIQGNLKAFTASVARRKAVDTYRRVIRHSSNIPIDDAGEIESGENIAQSAEESEMRKLLYDKVEELGEPDSTIIIQKYFYDRSSSETARILGMNPITVRSRLRRALKKLKATLTDMDITL